MYEDIKTVKEIDEKIEKLNYESSILQGCISGASYREMDRLEEQIKVYDKWIEEAKKRKEEILNNPHECKSRIRRLNKE